MGKRVVFMVGAGGSGKSYVLGLNPTLAGLPQVNQDHFIESNPNWEGNGGTRSAGSLRREARVWRDRQWHRRLAGEESFIMDGTGRDWVYVQGQIAQARSAGFEVDLIYVRCSLQTCLERNAQRQRQVPEHSIREAWKQVVESFPRYRHLANRVLIIDN